MANEFFPGYTSFFQVQGAFGSHCDFERLEFYTEQASENGFLTEYEKSELAFSLFQADICRALEEIHSVSTKDISMEDLRILSKRHEFWIRFDGTITKEKPHLDGGAWSW